MSAPLLGSNWKVQLESLAAGWDSYKAPRISALAISTLEHFSVVPCNDGGIQLEVHQDSFDIEVVISPDGKIASALICRVVVKFEFYCS